MQVHKSGDFRPVKASSGISKTPGYQARRTLCLRRFEELFGPILPITSGCLIEAEEPGDGTSLDIELPHDYQWTGKPWGRGREFLGALHE